MKTRNVRSCRSKPAAECECGNAKRRIEPACRSCQWLDGKSEAEGRLIAVLRLLSGPTSLYALALEAGLSYRQVLRTVKKLVRRRRLRKLIAGEEAAFGQATGDGIAATYVLRDRKVTRRRAALAA